LKEELKHLPLPVQSAGRGVAGSGKPKVPEQLRHRLEDELGDLFFVLVDIARYLSLDSESALKKTNRKFKRRFRWMEEQLSVSGRTPEQATTDELESLWQQAKEQEQSSNHK
jgi:ATP diphosphatase